MQDNIRGLPETLAQVYESGRKAGYEQGLEQSAQSQFNAGCFGGIVMTISLITFAIAMWETAQRAGIV